MPFSSPADLHPGFPARYNFPTMKSVIARLAFLIFLLPCSAAFGSMTAAQQTAQQEPAPQADAPAKKNARRATETSAPAEPFDKASPAEMSRQCVALDTEAGLIEIEMLGEAAPETARNFLNLAATGAFDTTTFSRIVKGFVVQGGNIATRESLTPALLRRASRTVPDEPNEVKHERGIVSMARSSEPNSATTHFFILVGTASHLDGAFSAFGRVRSGMDVVDRMNTADLDGETPKKPVRLRRASVAPCPQQP